MTCRENKSTSQVTSIYRGLVTSRYKKYRGPILMVFRGIGDGWVTVDWLDFFRIKKGL
jgi:hypothetical protein